jgi:hypothetical protein
MSNNPQSDYANHILDTAHEYGLTDTTMTTGPKKIDVLKS